MAFGRLGNRHDGWLAFCGQHRGTLAEAGLPAAIARHEGRFRDLLRDGVVSGPGVSASLAEWPPERWAGLVRFAAVFFHEYESFAPLDLFPAFRREAARRAAGPDAEPSVAGVREP